MTTPSPLLPHPPPLTQTFVVDDDVALWSPTLPPLPQHTIDRCVFYIKPLWCNKWGVATAVRCVRCQKIPQRDVWGAVISLVAPYTSMQQQYNDNQKSGGEHQKGRWQWQQGGWGAAGGEGNDHFRWEWLFSFFGCYISIALSQNNQKAWLFLL